MIRYLSLPGFLLLLILLPLSASAATDARMQVDIAAEKHGVEVSWLHANIRKAADIALAQLWLRIIPQHALDQLPKHVKAVRFLQKAMPTEQGVRILFNKKRVLNYLQHNNIPYYAEQSSEQPAELPPKQSADQTIMEAETPQSQIVQPRREQSPWRPQQAGHPVTGNQAAPPLTGLLTVQRQASLPEQILFEQDMAHNPHILSLTLRQVNRSGQQYRLKLKGLNDQWLRDWFRQRGMILTASAEGWVAQQAVR